MLLAIDTSAGTAVALVAGDRVLAERSSSGTMRHAEAIGTLIRDVLAEAAVAVGDIEGVVSGMGPGPFTGLRVGIAAARAFAFGAGIPVLPLVSHDAIAFEQLAAAGQARYPAVWPARGSSMPEPARDLLVVTDARRRERYWSRYCGLTPELLPHRIEGPALAKPDELPPAFEVFEAAVVSAAALGLLAERHRATGSPFVEPQPLYLRSPDVTPATGRKRVTR